MAFNQQGSSVNNPQAGLNTQKTWQGMLSPVSSPAPAQHQTPTTPVKSITTNSDGSSTSTYHPPLATNSPSNPGKVTGVLAPKKTTSTTTGGSSTTTPTPSPTTPPVSSGTNDVKTSAGLLTNPTGATFDRNTGQPITPPPAPLTTGGQAPNVLATGGQTANEATTFGGLINQSQNPSQAYTEGMANYNTANQKLADYNAKLAETDKNINAQGISLDSARGQTANVGQAATAEEAALQGGVTNASNILSAANAQQGLQVQAGTAANTAAQTQAGRATGAAENVLGAVQPTQVSPGNTLVNPATGSGVYGLGTTNGGNAYQNFSNLQFNTAQGQAYGKQASDLQTATNQTDQNFQTLSQLAGGLNLSQYPDINALNQAIQQKTGNAGSVAAFNEAYNALQTSIGQIINTSGAFTPSEIGNLTAQMSAAKLHPDQMQQLYDTVRKTAATKINTILEQAKKYESGGTSSVVGSMPNASGASQPLGGTNGGNMFGSFFGNQ